MRPIRLEMTAFGSYAGATEVPFCELRQGLYLVTGDTGAGKTTIFDAIMFALYGVASGRDRSPDMMHCDHVDKSVDTVVRLVFSQNGREYTVTRRIHFRKKRGAENEYGDSVIEALLEEPDAEPLQGAGRVTARCEELIGLNAEQFRKIVMLAQGEFREFLKADSDKKNEILGKLFDNRAYVYYRDLLGGARDELRRRRAAQAEALRQLMQSGFSLPEDTPAEERELYLPEHPALKENLSALIEREDAALRAFAAERERAQRAVDALNTQKGAAEELEQKFGELAARRAHEALLISQKEAVERRRTRYERAGAALHIAKPRIDRLEEAEKALTEARKKAETLEAGITALEAAVTAAQALVDGDEEAKAGLREREAAIRRIGDQLPGCRALAQGLSDKKAAEDAAAAADGERSRGEKALEEAEAAAAERKTALAGLEDIEARVVQCRHTYDECRKTLDALTGQGGVQDELRGIQKDEVRLAREEEALSEAAAAAMDAEQRHHALYRRFIAGQAGILAGQLARELTENDRAPCPVCGTRLSREQIPALAPMREGTPSQAEVDAARAAYDAAEKARAGHEKAAGILGADLRSRKDALLATTRRLLPDCMSWEKLSEEGLLPAAAERLAAETAAAETAYEAARRGQKEKFRLRQELETLEAGLPALREEVRRCTEAAQTGRARAQELAAVIRERRAQLDYADEDEAVRRKQTLENEKAELAGQIEAHQAALDDAVRRRGSAQAVLEDVKSSLPGLARSRDEARSALDEALAAAGFADPAAVDGALRPLAGADGEAWLQAERDALAAFDSDAAHTREEIARLAAQLEGRERVDPDALSQRLAEAAEAFAAANDRCTEQTTVIAGHRAVLARASELLGGLGATQNAWRRLERLGDLAVGASGEGGKLSFDRYVMGTIFREILEMANRRLDVMSGGRYELIHRSGADRKNAKAGLEIDVLDIGTGQQRSSASLSGGEAFFTSLALALGLSDVVQNHAGGKRMDALFIDEGFGTLSDDVLDRALDVLRQLTEGDRLVGIISHVDRLDESIPQKIRVKNTGHGSTLTMETA